MQSRRAVHRGDVAAQGNRQADDTHAVKWRCRWDSRARSPAGPTSCAPNSGARQRTRRIDQFEEPVEDGWRWHTSGQHTIDCLVQSLHHLSAIASIWTASEDRQRSCVVNCFPSRARWRRAAVVRHTLAQLCPRLRRAAVAAPGSLWIGFLGGQMIQNQARCSVSANSRP